MMPIENSNFLVAAKAVLLFVSTFFGSSLCYYFTTVKHNEFTLSLNFQGCGEVH